MTLPPTTRNTRDNADVVTLPPAEGTALIFPAWLTHSVEQNMTDQDRVSIAYNFRLKIPRGTRIMGSPNLSVGR